MLQNKFALLIAVGSALAGCAPVAPTFGTAQTQLLGQRNETPIGGVVIHPSLGLLLEI